ncbi:MAG: hypothetical protein ACRD88_21435, partial [Terriglobia bacterium]
MSEGEAFRRITAARLLGQFPVIYQLVESGAIHLSALALLSKHLTEGNHAELLREASGKSKRDVELLLAAQFPKADVPSRIRKLPDSRAQTEPALSATSEPPPAKPRAERLNRVEPLSAARYQVQFTADAALKEKLERAQNLLSHANPSRNLA